MEKIKNFTLINVLEIVKYNLKIIFGGKFFWFLGISLLIYMAFMFQYAYSGEKMDEGGVFSMMIIPVFLIIFYPTAYGIQNDADNKMLEIIFGIPNYRYKVWGVRLFMIFVTLLVMIFIFSLLTGIFLYPVDVFTLTFHVFSPMFFMGCLSFMLSTLTKSGNATALLLILCMILLFLILGNMLSQSEWNVFLNPLEDHSKIHPVSWNLIVIKNKIYLTVGAFAEIMIGFFNLQKRESFVR